jgi:hypothetical protein
MMRPLIEEFRRNPLFWLLVLAPVVLLAHAVNRDAHTLTSSEDPSRNLARAAEYVDKLSYGSKPRRSAWSNSPPILTG